MSSVVTISSVSGTPPYTVYVCNTLGTSCVLIASGITTVPISFTLPSTFDHVPAVMVKVIDSLNCETFTIETCSEEPYLIVYMEGQCGNYIVASGDTINGRPSYTYYSTWPFPPDTGQTFQIYWNSGTTEWYHEHIENGDICAILPFDRPVPVGAIGEWTNGPAAPCFCGSLDTWFYTEFTG